MLAHVVTPHSVINIVLELCFTVLLPLLQQHKGTDHINSCAELQYFAGIQYNLQHNGINWIKPK
jgi:hypothetical protein